MPLPPQLPFHLVQMSPWPLLCPILAAALLMTLVLMFTMKMSPYLLILNFILLLSLSFMWWRDVSREATFMGDHTTKVQVGLAWAMILFITSEVMFFSAFFWAFFHSSLSPTLELGCMWPPQGITPLNPFAVPLLNTGTLLSSGVTVTWAHHSLLSSNFQETTLALSLTILLGAYFTALQASEYLEASFSFNDSAYGSTFYIATGFHGIHVLVGTSFLLFCLIRHSMSHFSSTHHFGFEAAAWYWHFVDVVWILLFICLYWWGAA